jgi:hypothetical protein
MIRLRGHHLICLHFFQGEGYSPEFVDNLKEVISRAELGTPINIVDGADDVCASCPHLDYDKCMHKPDSDQGVALLDQMALKFLDLKPDHSVTWEQAKNKTESMSSDQFSEFCYNCDWENLCRKFGINGGKELCLR